MTEIEKLLEDLTEIEKRLNVIENGTAYKGPLIDAQAHVRNAREHLRQHARNSARRAEKWNECRINAAAKK